jgi:hypothetical protein
MELRIDTIAGEFLMRKIETKDFESLYHLMEFNREILLDYFPITSKNTSTKDLTKIYLRAKTAQMKEKTFYGFVAQPIRRRPTYFIYNFKKPGLESSKM